MASKPQFSTDHFALKLGLFYAAYFLFGGIQLPFFPLWLEARGLDARAIGLVIAVPMIGVATMRAIMGTAIGLVIAVPMIARIVATPIIAHQADRRRALKPALVIASLVGALA